MAAPYFHDRIELTFGIGVEGRHIDDIGEFALCSGKDRDQICECPLDLRFEVGLWHAVVPAADLSGDEQETAGADRGGISVFLVKCVPIGGKDGLAGAHGKTGVLTNNDL